MAALIPLAILPLAFLAAAGTLFLKRHRAPALWGLGAFALALAAGWWAIDQSRSSTAAIGFLFLPSYAAIAGTLAAAAASWRARPGTGFRVLGWLGLAVSIAIVAGLVIGGAQEIAKNRTRDAAYERSAR